MSGSRKVVLVLSSLGVVLACAAPASRPEVTAPVNVASTGTGATGAPEVPEPADIGADRHVAPNPPAGPGVWVVEPEGSTVTATVPYAHLSQLTFAFRGGLSGALDGEAGKGVFALDLTTLETADADHKADRKRDAAIVEGFLAARATNNGDVLAIWKKLAGKLAPRTARAALVVDKVSIGVGMLISPPAKVNPDYVETATIDAKLLLWNSVEIPLEVPVAMSRKGNVLEVKTSAPVKFDLERAVGSSIRKTLGEATVVAGFTSAREVGNTVAFSVRATMKLRSD